MNGFLSQFLLPVVLKTILFFRTVWEIKQKTLVDMAVDRGCFIDQSQSLNIHMDQPNFGKLTSLHFYAWSKVSTWPPIIFFWAYIVKQYEYLKGLGVMF